MTCENYDVAKVVTCETMPIKITLVLNMNYHEVLVNIFVVVFLLTSWQKEFACVCGQTVGLVIQKNTYLGFH